MKKNLTQSISVDVEVAGQSYSGSYTLDGDVVTAPWNGWTDSTQAGAAGAEITAKSLVRGLVRRYKDAE
jgi:hypothetical protein